MEKTVTAEPGETVTVTAPELPPQPEPEPVPTVVIAPETVTTEQVEAIANNTVQERLGELAQAERVGQAVISTAETLTRLSEQLAQIQEAQSGIISLLEMLTATVVEETPEPEEIAAEVVTITEHREQQKQGRGLLAGLI